MRALYESRLRSDRVRIGVDLTPASHALMGGTETYLLNLLGNLEALDGRNEYVINCRPVQWAEFGTQASACPIAIYAPPENRDWRSSLAP